MYRHYQGNSGFSRRVEEKPKSQPQYRGRTLAPLPEQSRPAKGAAPPPDKGEQIPKKPSPEPRKANQTAPPSPLSGLSGELGKLFGKLGSLSLETEDLLLIGVLYLMYRESGDKELLIMIGALLFL